MFDAEHALGMYANSYATLSGACVLVSNSLISALMMIYPETIGRELPLWVEYRPIDFRRKPAGSFNIPSQRNFWSSMT